MPDPLTGSLISGGANLLGSVLSNASTARQNRKSREFSERMYNRQYQDSLAFWNMQNMYNSPESQMNRFKDAGLNPNLIYGQGNSGNAGSIPTPQAIKPDFRPGDFSGVGRAGDAVLAGYMNMELKKAQHDNLLADNTVKLEEAALKQAQRSNVEQGTDRSVFDLNLDRELRSISADARRENLRKLTADTNMAISENERRAASNAVSIAEGVQRILNMRGVRVNLGKDAELKQLDINLKKKGIQPGDAMWLRVIGQAVERYGAPSAKDAGKALITPLWDSSWKKRFKKFRNYFK